MPGIFSRYTKWLHTQWPAGTVEKLPASGPNGATAIPGVRIVGDLTGIPLLKFSSHTGAEAVRDILREIGGQRGEAGTLDLAIVGAGVAGISAAIEAKKAGLTFAIYEATEIFSTVVNFPKAKPIYTYPTEMKLEGGLQFSADVKEALVAEMEAQRRAAGIEVTHGRVERLESKGRDRIVLHLSDKTTVTARNVIVAIGRSGNFRKLGVPGEELDKVYNRLFDPKEFAGQNALVVGGGDSALETAIALTTSGAHVTLSYRKSEFSRAKPENIAKIEALVRNAAADVQVEKPTSERVTTAVTSGMAGRIPGSLTLALGTQVTRIEPELVSLKNGTEQTLANDVVFTMLGREAPLDFFRRSGLEVRGDWTPPKRLTLAAIILICILLYHWKKSGVYFGVSEFFERQRWFPFNIPEWWASLGPAFANRANILGTLRVTLGEPGFYYSLAYTLCVTLFGLRRIRRRKTPYITAQTLTLMAFQVVPLFLLPYLVLPWAGNNGWFDGGIGKTVADALFPIANYGHGREYWRAFGLVLAWPLFFWNVFTDQPMWTWLIISFVQTFVLIPLIIFRWGKGAYCGWICSCGALAETLGDAHRAKMPHGPFWNRFNMLGQVFLAAAFFLLITRSLAWAMPGSIFGAAFQYVFKQMPVFNYVWFVDLLWAGIIGVGFYWHFSGRVWCRFACPLAALMHIYARFSRFRIFPEKSKCISCNVCTSVCHQGIDIMNFANKGLPMQDPQCVRCSACVEQCPTGVLAFGHYGAGRRIVLDEIPASPVRMREGVRH
ncbi:MAG TPA: NAD(P)-binding domain-containing protein [Chthoniobacterales bacterium]|nr:NAD(P)-binding domain-containing protein [Chthoniobacterales bacterium]